MKRVLNKIIFLLHTKKFEYVSIIFLRTLALSLISVFVPLYIYSTGAGMVGVAFYLMFYGLASLIGSLFTAHYIKHHGITHLIVLSIFFFMAGLYFLYSSASLLFIILAAIFLRVSEIVFWAPLHALFPFITRHKERTFGLEMALILLTPFLGPLIGAYIIDVVNYAALFFLASVVYLTSVIPLRDIKRVHKVDIPLKHYNLSFRYALEGFRTAALSYVWPLFLFVNVLFRVDEVASVNAVIALVGGVTSLWVAARLKDGMKKFVGKLGAYLHSISILLRAFPSSFVVTSLISAAGAAGYAFIQPVYMGVYYNRVKKSFEEILARENSIGVGLFTGGFIIVLGLSLGASNSLAWVIGLASLTSAYFGWKVVGEAK